MSQRLMWTLLGLAALAAGCERQPPASPEGDARLGEPRPDQVRAIQPHDGAVGVRLQPRFRWTLPEEVADPNVLSVVLFEVGPEGAEPKKIAIASGLSDVSKTELDLFDPPPGAIVTFEAPQIDRLKPDTWYRWEVRAFAEAAHARNDFVFRTRPADAADAPPEPAPE